MFNLPENQFSLAAGARFTGTPSRVLTSLVPVRRGNGKRPAVAC